MVNKKWKSVKTGNLQPREICMNICTYNHMLVSMLYIYISKYIYVCIYVCIVFGLQFTSLYKLFQSFLLFSYFHFLYSFTLGHFVWNLWKHDTQNNAFVINGLYTISNYKQIQMYIFLCRQCVALRCSMVMTQ